MAQAALTADRRPDRDVRRFEITDLTGKDWHIRVRAGLPFEMTMWGAGHHVRCDGHSHYFQTREAAHAAGLHWIVEGR